MEKHTVAQIEESDALALNDGLDDNNKVAWQNADRTAFYIKDPSVYPTSLDSSKYFVTEISQSVVDGSFPATKPIRIYP